MLVYLVSDPIYLSQDLRYFQSHDTQFAAQVITDFIHFIS